MARRILVVSAHIGDEMLGCGGALLRHRQGGDDVRAVILGEGWTSRTKSLEKGLEALDLEAFEAQARQALAGLSIKDMHFHRLPDNRFDQLDLLDVVKVIEAHKAEFSPHVVYTNTAADLGIDQRITAQAVMTAFRPLPGEIYREILAFEVRSSTEWTSGRDHVFEPNCFVDITMTLEGKLAALRALGTELRPWPHSRSLEAVAAQAKSRGATVGVGAAEAFALMRSINRLN
jgi:LmbE family N-acetylglucosaminyl deacetylase